MKNRVIALIVLAAMMLCLFAACDKKGPVTQDEAKEIALESLNLKASDADDIHVHIGEVEGVVCYNIHVTVGDQEYSVYINADTGEIVDR